MCGVFSVVTFRGVLCQRMALWNFCVCFLSNLRGSLARHRNAPEITVVVRKTGPGLKRFGCSLPRGLPVVRFAAVTYGSEAHLQFNLGDADVDSTEKLVKRIGQIRRAFGGTASEAALEEVLKVIVPMSDEGRKRFMIFITDGRSNIGASPERKADELKDVYGFEIYAIGVGNKINDKELAAVASKPYEEHVIEVRNHKALDEGLKKAAEVKIGGLKPTVWRSTMHRYASTHPSTHITNNRLQNCWDTSQVFFPNLLD